MKTPHTLFVLILLVFAFTSCKPKYTEPELHADGLNLESFVMIGDGHAAGYMDDALYRYGQEHGVATLLSIQLEEVGANPLSTNWVIESSVGSNANGNARLVLNYKTDCNGISSLSPVRVANQGDLDIIAQFSFTGTTNYSNFCVPGLRTTHTVTPNLAQFNPFFARVASSENSTVLQDALSKNPTFFGIYLGIEDVMTYAKSGGTVQLLPAVEDFTATYSLLVQQLTQSGAKGFVATIPDVSVMPYFRTIPYNGLNLDSTNAATLSNIFGPLGYNFSVGANPFTIVDPNANDFEVRQIYPDELLLLSIPLDSVKCNKMGSIFPFRNEFVLIQEEIAFLKSKISAYNTAIRNIAQQCDLAVVETNTVYQKLFSGFTFNGVRLTAQFVSGGAFSLDGIHLNARGNALVTNEIIKTINQHYQTKIRFLNPLSFDGVLFP